MFRVLSLTAVALLVVVGAMVARPDQGFLATQLARTFLQPEVARAAAAAGPGPAALVLEVLPGSRPDTATLVTAAVRVRDLRWVEPGSAGADGAARIGVRLTSGDHCAELEYRLGEGPPRRRIFAWYGVLPPLLAIVAAILTRHVVLSLSVAVLAGGVLATIPAGGSVMSGIWHAFEAYLIRHALLDAFRLDIILFVLLISGTVGIARDAGGIRAMIDLAVRFCRTPRSARLAVWAAGMMLFFDDYLNCLVVGNTMRPLTDRHRVSRAKLAYLVDSTAAPVAGLSIISTWIIFETMQIREGLQAAGLDLEPFMVFVRSLPYRFYCVFTLLLGLMLAIAGRDFGPMLAAERQARAAPPAGETPESAPHAPVGRAWLAVAPVGLIVTATLLGLWWTGRPESCSPPWTLDSTSGGARAVEYLQKTLAHCNSARALSRAAMLGYAVALAAVLAGRIMGLRAALRASLISIQPVLKAIVVLFLAWSIGAASRDVGTAGYLVAVFRDALHPIGFALIVFGLGCLVSFATGSSYSTMAILLPNVVPLALAVGEHSPLTGIGLVIMSVGAVLEGSIFGDHCSPISDTTILSSISSGCDLLEHVRTQMPYALTAAAAAVLAGYLPVSLQVPWWLCLPAGAAGLLIAVMAAGRKA